MKTTVQSNAALAGFKFDNSYISLNPALYRKQHPQSVRQASLLLLNEGLAETLGLNTDVLRSDGHEFLSGNAVYEDSEPVAQAYAGHQFGGFNILGDGRAILLGEHITPGNIRVDIQLKGSGRTAYSRSGDGRAALGPMLREYIMSEAMHALGIPTTRSLAIVTTGESVYRDEVYPGAVLTRIASSHIRVGTFQYAAILDDINVLTELADYTINRHFPELNTAQDKYIRFLERVIDLQAALIARWLHVGFIHGVMNTDNMSICGETIDYGPCAFMNRYDPAAVFSSIDSKGRYAFGNQAPIAHWNLTRFAETLLPLLHADQTQAVTIAKAALEKFPARFIEYWVAGMRKKLGIFHPEEQDLKLAEDLLMHMQKNKADYTNTFRSLGKASMQDSAIYEDPAFKNWLQQWQERLSRQPETFAQSLALMDQHNPAIIPRNHLVEQALSAAADQNDLKPLKKLLEAVANPYHSGVDYPEFTQAPPAGFDERYKTFCGT